MEKHGAQISKNGVYIWGQRTLEYYRINSDLTSVMWRQPTPGITMSLLDDTLLRYTSLNFPARRRWLEYNTDGKFQLFPPNSDGYDPCFLLHVLSNHIRFFSSEVDLRSFWTRQCLGVCVASLTSQSRHLRAMAAASLTRFFTLLTTAVHSNNAKMNANFPERSQVHYLLDCLRQSLASHSRAHHRQLTNAVNVPAAATAMYVKSYQGGRIPSLHAHLFVRMLTLLLKPNARMFTALWDFFLAKPTVDFSQVPEFIRLLYSTNVDFRVDRQWLLLLLSESLNENADYLLMEKSQVFKHLLVAYALPTIDSTSQVYILKLLEAAAQVPLAAHSLIRYHALTNWLYKHMLNAREERVLVVFARILKNLDHVVQKSKSVTQVPTMVQFLVKVFRETHGEKIFPRDITAYLFTNEVV